jgi:hypothetical protein
MPRRLLLLIAVQASISLIAPRLLPGQGRTSSSSLLRVADLNCSVQATRATTVGGTGPVPSIDNVDYEHTWLPAYQIQNGATIEGPVDLMVRVRVTNSGVLAAHDVPVSVRITANGQPVKQIRLGPWQIADYASYTFYGTYPVPVTVSLPLVPRAETVARTFGPSFPGSLHTLGPEKTYALSLKATIDPANTVTEQSNTNNECSIAINVRYPAVLIPTGR